MVFLETLIFTRQVTELIDDDNYREMQQFLVRNPGRGKIIQGSGGIRKIEWTLAGRGKKGGMRVIYYWQVAASRILMLFLYPKNVQDDLTKEQLKRLKDIVEQEFM